MIRPQAARRPPAARRLQCAVMWDRNLKPKLAIMRQCTSVTDRRTEFYRQKHDWHHGKKWNISLSNSNSRENMESEE